MFILIGGYSWLTVHKEPWESSRRKAEEGCHDDASWRRPWRHSWPRGPAWLAWPCRSSRSSGNSGRPRSARRAAGAGRCQPAVDAPAVAADQRPPAPVPHPRGGGAVRFRARRSPRRRWAGPLGRGQQPQHRPRGGGRPERRGGAGDPLRAVHPGLRSAGGCPRGDGRRIRGGDREPSCVAGRRARLRAGGHRAGV